MYRSAFSCNFLEPSPRVTSNSSENVCGQKARPCGCKLVAAKTTENACGQGTDNRIVSFAQESHQKIFLVRKHVNKKKRKSFVVRERVGNHHSSEGQKNQFQNTSEMRRVLTPQRGAPHTTDNICQESRDSEFSVSGILGHLVQVYGPVGINHDGLNETFQRCVTHA